MIVGYDAKRIVSNGTGLGSYSRTLVNSLSENQRLKMRLYAPDKGCDDFRQQVILRSNISFIYPDFLHFRFQRDLWRIRGVVNQLRRDGVQLYHGLSGELPIGLKAAGIPGIVTVHDLIFLRHPEYYHRFDVQIYRWKFFHTLREADRIIAISECTKRDILAYGNFPEDKIDVIYQSCSLRFRNKVSCSDKQRIRMKYHLPVRYILNVGSIEMRKNMLLVVKALQQLPTDISLVIIGRHTSYTDKILKYVHAHKLEQRVLILHGISDDDLPAIYQQAEVFVYPSRYEGFGIPIIEAIQSGLPVVACTGSCLEEAGGPDCLYVDPDDVSAMAAAILKSFEEKKWRVIKSREYIRQFENRDLASLVIREYQKTV